MKLAIHVNKVTRNLNANNTALHTIMFRNQEGWIAEYENVGALWIRPDNPSVPHAELRSKLHSDGFFLSKRVTDNDQLLDEVAADLLTKLIRDEVEHSDILHHVDGVVGPQTGATRLAEFLAKKITEHTDNQCFSASPFKITKPSEEIIMEFTPEEEFLVAGRTILLCEDVITTGGSINRTVAACMRAGAQAVLPHCLAMVNRSGQSIVDSRVVHALIVREFSTYEPRECPLCAAGSPLVVDPKRNWDKLTGKPQS